MYKFEYKLFTADYDSGTPGMATAVLNENEQQLNNMGWVGWELVAVIPLISTGKALRVAHCFKRLLQTAV